MNKIVLAETVGEARHARALVSVDGRRGVWGRGSPWWAVLSRLAGALVDMDVTVPSCLRVVEVRHALPHWALRLVFLHKNVLV